MVPSQVFQVLELTCYSIPVLASLYRVSMEMMMEMMMMMMMMQL